MKTAASPADPFERSQWILFELRKRGMNVVKLATANNLKPSTLYQAFRIPSFPSERILAEALGTTPQALFPERYDAAGRRRHRLREVSGSTAARNVKERHVG